MLAHVDVKRETMTRTRKEIQDANALLIAMQVFVITNDMQHLFGDALNTIQAAIDEIHMDTLSESSIKKV
jgi:hypothetical protein